LDWSLSVTEAVNQAYKDLAFIWHPDRIPKDNLRLQQKAQEKLKEINQARDQLRSILPSGQNQNAQPQPSPKTSRRAITKSHRNRTSNHPFNPTSRQESIIPI